MRPTSADLKHWSIGLLVFVLWLATVVVAVVEVFLLQSIATSVYARFGSDFATALLVRNCAAVSAGLACAAVALGTAEYHWRNGGQMRSWKLFGWTVGIELAILLLYFIV